MTQQDITIIAAVASDGAIGRGGDMLWHIRGDLRRFKARTRGHTVVMGRRTFESLPKGALPGRRNIVVTRNNSLSFPGAETASGLEAALAMTAPDEKVFIIGGGEIYRQAMPLAAELDITEIDGTAAGADTFFPSIPAEFELAEASETVPAEGPVPPYRFATYRRK